MKKRNIFKKAIAQGLIAAMLASITIGVQFGTSAGTAFAASSATNLDFESGDMTGWAVTGTAGIDTSNQHGGAASVKLSAASTTITQTLTGIDQGSYTLSAWVKGNTSSNSANITATNTGGPDTKSLIDAYISSTEWTQLSIRNVLVYNGQATITIASGTGTNLLVDDIELTLDSSDNNPVTNWNFETGSLTGWTIDNGVAIAGGNADTGSVAAVLNAESQISQTISVKPNTDYIATVRAKVDKQDVTQTIQQTNYLGNTGQLVNVVSYGDRINLGVKNLKGTVLRQVPDGTTGYALLTLRFKTGPGDSQVNLYANTMNDERYLKSVQTYNSDGANASHDEWTGNGTDKAYVDNFDVFEVDNSTIKGADVSFLPIIEDKGGKYFANGVQQDCLTILANHGVNSITGMLFVHSGNAVYDQSSPKQQMYSDFTDENGNPFPYTMQAGYFDKTHAYKLALRAKDLDISYLPSFHFSDGWMSAGKAYTSLDWMYKDSSGKLVDQSLDEMTTTMYNYVYDFIKGLKDQGTPPSGVKIGNEQDGGIAWPTGKGYKYEGFKALINAAYDAVHDAAPGVSAYIHSNNGYNPDNSNTIYGTLRTNGVRFDGQAYSLYSGHPTDAILSMITNDLTNFPDKDYLDVETGYAFTKYNPDYADESGSMGQSTYYAASSANGQYNWLLDYMQALRDVPNPHDRMRGFYYWETDWITVEGAGSSTRGPNTVDRRTMFNNGDTSIKEMGSTANGKMGDMMDSMYAYLWRGHAKNKETSMQSPLKGFGTYSVTKSSPTGITLDQASMNLVEGKTQRLLPTITPDSNSSSNKLVFDSQLTWTSSDPDVAKVNNLGYVTAVGVGTATITATTKDGGLSATSTVTVTAAEMAGAGNLSLTVGGNTGVSTLSAKVWDQLVLKASLPSGATKQNVTFQSSDPSVASFLGEFWQSSQAGALYQQSNVTQNVKLNVKHDGTTTITAASADGTASSSFILNVSKIAVTGVTVNKASTTVSLGRTEQLTATVAPANASFNAVSWTSSDPKVAAVDNKGLVTSVSTGTTTITATSDDDSAQKATCIVTIVPVMVTGLTLDKPTLNLMIGSTKPITAIITPDDAFNKKVDWTSSDSAVATVDSSGKVSGITKGTATITALTEDGGFTQSSFVNVQTTPVSVTGITLDKGSYYFASNYFSSTTPDSVVPVIQLNASVIPTEATNTEVVWSSNNPTVASVDAYGKVTAVKAGAAVITATTKDGNLNASTNIYVPSISENFDNRTIGDNWTATAGSASAYAAGVASPTTATSQVFSLTSSGSGARAEYKSFSVSNNKIVLDFDWNVGAPSTGATGQLRIQDSAHKNYITFGVPTSATGTILYETSATIASNTSLANTGKAIPVAASGFKTANASYNVQVTLDMTAQQTSFTMTNKADATMTTTVSNLPFASGTTYNNNLGFLEFYTTRATGGTAGWATWLDNFNVYSTAPVAASVSLNKASLSLLDIAGTVGNTAQLTATVNPNMTGVDQAVTWTSSDPAVATVNSTGLVTAVADGTATITATSVTNTALKAAASVSVHPIIPVEAIGIKDESGNAVDETTVNMNSGDSKLFTVSLNPGSADYRSIIWSSSDPLIATVDPATGQVTAVGPGDTTITLIIDAYKDYGGFTGQKSLVLHVTGDQKLVISKLKTAIDHALAAKLNGDEYYTTGSLSVYNTALATAQSDFTTAQTEKWDKTHQSQIDKAAADLDNAVSGLTASTNIPATAINISLMTSSLTAGKTGQLITVFTPIYATNQSLSWTSSDSSIVSVDQNGLVTALVAGSATITATTTNGKTSSIVITVNSDLTMDYMLNGGSITASVTKSGYTAATPVTKQTAWTSGANLQTTGTPVYWQVDLGNKARIDNVKMNFWQSMKYALMVSDDGANWTTAVDHSSAFSGTAAVFTENLPEKTFGRYIRLMIYGVSTTTDWVGLVSFQANGAFVNAPTEITLSHNEAVLAPNDTLQLSSNLAPLNADPRVTWSSSDSTVATVNESGLVTAIGVGTAILTVTASNGIHAAATITVSTGELIPNAPTGLLAAAHGTTEVTLTWEASPRTVSYSVYRSELENGPFVMVNSTEVTGTGYNDTGLTANTTYFYKISALNKVGESAQTNAVVVKTDVGIVIPSAPEGLLAVANGKTKVNLSWSGSIGTVTYSVYRVNDQNKFEQVGITLDTTYTDSGLTAGTEYTYMVKAENQAGISDFSEAAKATTEAEGTLVIIPVQPMNLTVKANGDTIINLSWTVVDRSEGYNVYRSLTENGVYSKINDTLLTTNTFSNTNLAANTKYFYKVTAVNTAGESEASVIAFGVTDNLNSNIPVPTADTKETTQVSGSTITVNKAVNINGTQQITVTSEAVKQALASGSNKLTIQVLTSGSVTDGKEQVTIPVKDIVGLEGTVKTIELNTSNVNVTISTKLTAGILSSDSKQLEVSVSKVDTESLPDGIKEQLKGHPVYDLDLSVDGNIISRFKENDSITVTINYALQPGENPHEIVVYHLTDDGKIEVIKNAKYNSLTGKVSFNPKHFSRYAVAYVPVSFNDLDQAPWAKTMIEALAAKSITKGTEEGHFDPNRSVTRAEFLQMLLTSLDLLDDQSVSSFSDVKQGAWYYNSVATAEKLGIAKGSDGLFRASDTITREDMAVMLSRAVAAAHLTLNGASSSAFKDQNSISEYAVDSIIEIQKAGLVNGFADGSFGPKQQTTRAQAAAVIYKLLNQ